MPARVAGFEAAFEPAHTRGIESNPQQDTCPYKCRVDMGMSPIVVPYPGHEYHVYTRWHYSLLGI